jgi:ankyrin repeat protein
LAGALSLAPHFASLGQEAALVSAAKAGQWNTVFRLVDQSSGRAAANEAEPDGTTALHWAVHGRNDEAVRDLVRAGANVDAVNRYGESALSLAVRDANASLVEFLLQSGADPAAAERALPDGQTLAMLAARTGSTDALKALASHAAVDVDARETRTETTALMWAALDDRADALRYLLRLGADPNLRSKQTDYPHLGNGVLLTAPEPGVSFVGQTPLQRGGWTALMYAARSGARDAVGALTEARADLNALDPLGESALTLAIVNGHWQVVDALLDAGADPNVADEAGSTPLYAAVDFHTLPDTYGRAAPKPEVVTGSVAVVKRLLDAGAHVDAPLAGAPLRRQYTAGDGRLKAGATPLMRAAATADLTLMRVLLDAGADVRAAEKNGATALLLAAGAARGDVGAADYVSVDRAIEAVRLCMTAGGDLRGVDGDGKTALHVAAAKGVPAMIEFLAGAGVPIDRKDKRGRTALDLAVAAKSPDDRTIAALRRLTGAE